MNKERLQREFPQLQKRYWGRHLWARGYFSSTMGAVTEAQIKQYITVFFFWLHLAITSFHG